MNIYLKSIHINKLLHLSDFDINVCEGGVKRHLLITGPNGTGKTLLLNAIADYLERISRDSRLEFLEYEKQLKSYEQYLASANTPEEKVRWQKSVDFRKSQVETLTGKVCLAINDVELLPKSIAEKQFLLAYYGDQRRSEFKEVKNPEKPNLEYENFKVNKVGEFLKFLVDLKVQRALAEGENAKEYAHEIDEWFEAFRNLLRSLFEDKELDLEFDFKTYAFYIHSFGKKFKFTELSAGYSAALDIIVDLILKMQGKNQITRAFNMPGIVLIDEIETHLHLKMQKEILPLLATLFPNIQLVVTTHSPFVLNSLSNAVAYDLQRHEEIDDLTDYSYDALAEGYFGVDMASGKMLGSVERFETLSQKAALTLLEKDELKQLMKEIKDIPDVVAPSIKERYYSALATMTNVNGISSSHSNSSTKDFAQGSEEICQRYG